LSGRRRGAAAGGDGGGGGVGGGFAWVRVGGWVATRTVSTPGLLAR